MGVVDKKAVWSLETEGRELARMTIGDALDRQAAAAPDKEALVYRYPEIGLQVRLTYREYRAATDQLAKALMALGVAPGERVAVWAPNVPEWVLLEMALAKIGAVLVTINTAYRADELDYVLRQSEACALFCAVEFRNNPFLEHVFSIAPEVSAVADPLRERVASAQLPHLRHVCAFGDSVRKGVVRYADLLDAADAISDADLRVRQTSVSPDDVAQIQYTSGTTGFPKGAMLTHYAMVNNCRLINHRAGVTSEYRIVTAMPFFHTSGCVIGVLGTLLAGGTLIPLIAFDPVKELELIQAERATYIGCVPTMLLAMIHHPRFGEFDLSSLERVTSGGTPVPVSVMEEVREKMGADVTILFGQTESGPVITQTLAADSFELKSETVGVPLPHTEIKIVSPDTDEPVGLGEPGELLTRGYLTMRGYYKMPDKTEAVMGADGWLRTGDLATMDGRGYVRIVGRVKDMIIRGGENVYPAEIEALLMRHPKVADAQVVGVPDEFMGEEAAAAIRLRPDMEATEAELREFCRARISHYKVPKHFVFVADYPLTANGKVKKFELRKRIVATLTRSE
jgi:fatty-acyl-CoA synthase